MIGRNERCAPAVAARSTRSAASNETDSWPRRSPPLQRHRALSARRAEPPPRHRSDDAPSLSLPTRWPESRREPARGPEATWAHPWREVLDTDWSRGPRHGKDRRVAGRARCRRLARRIPRTRPGTHQRPGAFPGVVLTGPARLAGDQRDFVGLAACELWKRYCPSDRRWKCSTNGRPAVSGLIFRINID
jgi:hypothetical protein